MDDVVAVITDLFFQARINAAARAAGRTVRYIGAAAGMETVTGYRLALVDLDAQIDIPGTIAHLKSLASGPIVAFGPHLDTERRKAARAAGAHRVLAKSKFVTELPRLMNGEQTSAGTPKSSDLDTALAELAGYGKRMEELGKMLQDRRSIARLYFAPAPHMEEAEAQGEPIILDAADYLGFLAVDLLRSKLEHVRSLMAGGLDRTSG